MYSNYLEFNKKITGYGCIAITLIMNKIANTASNVIIRETGKKCYGKKPLYQNVYNTIWRSLWCFCITSISWTFVTFNLFDIITPSYIFWHPLSICLVLVWGVKIWMKENDFFTSWRDWTIWCMDQNKSGEDGNKTSGVEKPMAHLAGIVSVLW